MGCRYCVFLLSLLSVLIYGPLALCVAVESYDTLQYHCTLSLCVNAEVSSLKERKKTKEGKEGVLEIMGMLTAVKPVPRPRPCVISYIERRYCMVHWLRVLLRSLHFYSVPLRMLPTEEQSKEKGPALILIEGCKITCEASAKTMYCSYM